MRNVRLRTDDAKAAGKHDFDSDFEKQLIKIFGQEDYTELTTVRQYSATTRSQPLVKNSDIKYKKSQEFYDYLTNPQADMMRIELEILGDPSYVCQDLFTNLGKTNIPYFKDPWSHTYGSFNAEGYQPIIMLNYRLPSDFDEKKGVFDFTNTNRSMFFNGIYQVVKIESSIAQGSFTQTLHCVRLNNQKGTGKIAAKFTTGLNEKEKTEENIEREIIPEIKDYLDG
jgi:hypothetical protein